MSLNKFTAYQTGIDLNLEIGADNLECNNLIVLNSITLPPNVFVDNLTVNDSLTIVCDDTSTYNLTTATNGNLGDILSTDGNGNTFWTTVPLPPLSGIVYSGTVPAEVGRILQISNPTATTCTKSSILEDLTYVNIEKPIQLTTNKITSTYVPLNNDDLVNKLYVDNIGIQGPTGPQGIQGIQGIQGPTGQQGEQGTSSNLFLYLADTTTLSGYPTDHSLSWNSVTQISSTNIRVSHLDDNGAGTDIDAFLGLVQIGQQLLIQDRNVSSNYQTWLVNGTPVNSNPATPTSYWAYPVSLVSSSGTGTTNFANNHDLFLAIISGSSLIVVDSVGSGTSLISSNVNPNFYLKSLVGSGINLTNTTNEITLTNSLPSTLISLTNSGTGSSILNSTSNPSFSTKGIINSTGIGLTSSATDITLINSLPSTLISLTTGGVAVGTNSLVSTTSGNPALKTKGIVAGSNITITDSGTDLTINSSAGGGTYTFQNGGTGTSLVATTSGITDFKPVSITAGSNVTIAGSGTDNLVISSAGALGTNTVNITAVTTSASTYYPVFNATQTGVTSTLSTDFGGLSYVPTSNLLLTGAMNSGIYTSTVTPPAIGFVGHASSCNKVQTTDGSGFTSTYYPTFCPLSTSATSQEVITDLGLTYIPSQNRLTTDNFNGAVFTSSSVSPTIGFVGECTTGSKIRTTDGSTFTSSYFITFVPLSASSPSQAVSTDTALPYNPSTNLLGLVANTNYIGVDYTSSKNALVAGFIGTCSNTLEVAQTNVETATSTYYPMLSVSSASSTTLNPSELVNVDSGLSYLPSTNALTATTFVGALSGNATTATNINIAGTNQLLIQNSTNVTSVLSQGTSGQFLRSNGASLPTWDASRGFTQGFGGKSILLNDYLTPGKFADTLSTSVITSSYLSQYRSPIACSITAWSSTVQTTSAAQLSIVVNGVAGTAILGIATATSQSGSITARTVNANDLIEVRITNAICNACLIILYFS